jgi:DNA-binding MarR family transcriptional regulator
MTTSEQDVSVAMKVLAAASEVIDGIQVGMATRGYPELRPAHGFAFARIAQGDASVLDIAEHLGVSKQAASQLVEQLVTGGYVDRRRDEKDARRWLLDLTARGQAGNQAAGESAAEVVSQWQATLGADGVHSLDAALGQLEFEGPLKPVW